MHTTHTRIPSFVIASLELNGEKSAETWIIYDGYYTIKAKNAERISSNGNVYGLMKQNT